MLFGAVGRTWWPACFSPRSFCIGVQTQWGTWLFGLGFTSGKRCLLTPGTYSSFR